MSSFRPFEPVYAVEGATLPVTVFEHEEVSEFRFLDLVTDLLALSFADVP